MARRTMGCEAASSMLPQRTPRAAAFFRRSLRSQTTRLRRTRRCFETNCPNRPNPMSPRFTAGDCIIGRERRPMTGRKISSGARVVWLLAFIVAMAYVESAVVVYLREIYYPGGFDFPIVIIPNRMAAIEVGREAATIVMILGVAMLAGSDSWERFLFFCLAFAVWDLLYYVWLRVFIGWPPSLMTWDILFLIPVPWLGPVLAPVLVSLAMIAASSYLLSLKARGSLLGLSAGLWTLAIAGGLVVILSFTIDFASSPTGRDPPP